MLFRFFGKLIGKAFFDKIPVNLCLNRQIYLALLKQTNPEDYSNLDDFNQVDVSVFHSLKFFRDNDLREHEDVIDQFFEHSNDEGKTIELLPGGSSKRVTNENKHEFIRLKSHFIGYKCCKSQLDSLTEGFYSVVPFEWIAHLTVEELEVQLCG
jgi:E3 ubiquitin-protein ligase HUWE1